ncbi:MAG: dihydroflavonol-4-reductase [Mariniblastus sp.]|jgi:dihydroflavonol-4-reductase
MRILITGATGFLGNNLTRVLLRQGHHVTAAVRTSSNLKTLDGLDVELVETDLSNSSDIAIAMEGVDVVVHAAALIHLGWTRIDASRMVNVESTTRIAESARRRGIRMIHVSTVDALGLTSEHEPGNEDRLDPPNPACAYVVSKREAETAVILEVSQGLDAVIVNPGFLVGPYDWKPSSGEMMLTLARRFIPYAPAGGCSVADVRDVADGIVSAMEHGRSGERYILGGENLSYLELWQMMSTIMKRRPTKQQLPNWMAAMAGKTGDLIGRLTGTEPLVNSAATQMGQIFHYYESSKAKHELGYQIGSVEDAVNDAWDWFKQHEYV